MTSMQVENIFSLLQKSDDSAQLLKCLESINSSLLVEDQTSYVKELYSLVVSNLENSNKDIQIAALDALNNCIKRNLFMGSDYKDLALIVVNIIKLYQTDNVEQQEIFIKATTCLQEMTQFHLLLYQTRPTDMIYILKKILNSSVGVVNKIHALKMLENFAKNACSFNEQMFLTIWMEDICPIMFNMTQNNNLLNSALEYSNNMLPMHLRLFFQQDMQLYNKFVTTAENTYIPIIAHLVTKEQTIFSQLWIYLCKLLSVRFHIGFQLVNMMLAVVETAFKSQNIEIRHSAFICWQVLITEFLNNPELTFTDKRVKLLSLPLKANNTRSEQIALIKFDTWCILLNALIKRHINVASFNIIDNFLQFCFGPLHEQTLLTWLPHGSNANTYGKRYPVMYLNKCKAFLQLFGLKKYIDDSLMLNYFEFSGPILTLKNFEQAKPLINAVGECSVLLSSLKDDNNEKNLILTGVWKTLFDLIDHLEDTILKENCIQHTCSLITIIACLSRKKPELINNNLLPIFTIITSGEFEFLKQNKISEHLILPFIQTVMKKDKILLQKDIVVIFKKIFTFNQQHHTDFLKFAQLILSRFSLGIKENLNEEKTDILRNIWVSLVEDLKVFLHNNTITDEEFLCSTFSEILLWPVLVINQNFSNELLAIKWKELYFIFGVATSVRVRNNLAVRMLKFCENKPQFLAGVSRIICYILYQFNTIYNNSDLGPEITEIFKVIKSYVFLENLNNEVVDILQKAFQKLISSSSVYPYFLEDYVMENILHLITHYNRVKLLEEIVNISKFYTNKTDCFEKFNVLLQILSEKKIHDNLIENIKINLHKKIRKSDNSINVFGHNIDKPRENNDEILFNTVSTLNTKKLTKSQKEKLSKRKDDIPALYADLTQSTQEFSNSFDKTENSQDLNPEKAVKKRGRKTKEKENQILTLPTPENVEETDIANTSRGKRNYESDPDYEDKKYAKKTRKRNSGSQIPETGTEIVKNVKSRRSVMREDLHKFLSESDESGSQVSDLGTENVKKVKNRRVSAIKRDENFITGSEIEDSDPDTSKTVKNRKVSAAKRDETVNSDSDQVNITKNRKVPAAKREGITKMSPESENMVLEPLKVVKKRRVSIVKVHETVKIAPENVNFDSETPKIVKNRKVSIGKREEINKNSPEIVNFDSETPKSVKNRKVLIGKREEINKTSTETGETDKESPKIVKNKPISPRKREEINKIFPETIHSDPETSKLVKNRRFSLEKREEINKISPQISVSDSETSKLVKSRRISVGKRAAINKTSPEISILDSETSILVKNQQNSVEKREAINKTSPQISISDSETSKLVKNRRLSVGKREEINETSPEILVSDPESLKLVKNRRISVGKREEINKTSPEISVSDSETSKLVKNRRLSGGKREEINTTSPEILVSDPETSKLVKNRRLSVGKREEINKTSPEISVSDPETSKLVKNRRLSVGKREEINKTSPEISVSDPETSKLVKNRRLSVGKREEINKTSPEILVSDPETSKLVKNRRLSVGKRDETVKTSPEITDSDPETSKLINNRKISTAKRDEINKTSPEIKDSDSEITKLGNIQNTPTTKQENKQNKVFTVPLILSRNKKQDVQKIMEDNLSDYETLDEKVKSRVSKELLRIQMDIKNTGDFYKHRRKTRLSGNQSMEDSTDDDKEKLEKPKRKSPEQKRKLRALKQELDVIEPTPNAVVARKPGRPKLENNQKTGKILKQIKLPVLYPLDSIKPGERVFISSGQTSTDIIKGPDPSSPFRVLENVSLPVKTPTCKELCFQSPEKPIPGSPKIHIISNELLVEAQKPPETETASLEMLPESQNQENLEMDFSSRKVLFDEPETLETTELTGENMEDNLPGSPVNVETPTRNKELIKSTSEISPIKIENSELEKPSSPETSVPERVGNNSPHPQRIFLRKKGRGAQMMDLVSVKIKTNQIPDSSKSEKTEKVEISTPHQTRTMKMMENLGNLAENSAGNSEEIKDEDILTFQRELPSPMASPGLGILKKRKYEDTLEAIITKRRRVNFHDPPVSSRKYIEITAKNRLNNSNLIEERVTRSKADEIEIEINIDDLKQTLFPTNTETSEENVEKFNEVSVIKNSESLFSETFPQQPEEPEEVNVFETYFPEPNLEENVEKIVQIASEKPEIQSYLAEKVIPVLPLETILDVSLNKYSFYTIIETVVECYKNKKK